jgi:Zn-dependent protease with chaperone function
MRSLQPRLAAALGAALLCVAVPAAAAPSSTPVNATTGTPPAPVGGGAKAPATVMLAPRSVGETEPMQDYRLPPERRERADRAAHVYRLVYVTNLTWHIVSLLLILALRLAPRLEAFTGRLTKRRPLQTLLFGLFFTLLFGLLDVPVDIWQHALDRSYGLSVQGWGSFARDWLTSLSITVLLSAPFVVLIYWILRRSPRRWWLWTWMALLPILVFLDFIQPVLIDPLYYRYTPLVDTHPALVERLREIASKRGVEVPRERIFEMNASTKLRTVNAFARGYGSNKRIIVWDTSLQAMNEREIAFLFGHELGHYVENHILIGEMVGTLGLLVELLLAAWLLERLVQRRGARWGIPSAQSLASFPLLMLILALVGYARTPSTNGLWRYLEHRADAFGLAAITGVVDDPRQAAAHTLQRLGEIDLAPPDPHPLAVLWFYNHPPLRERVRFVLGREP